MHRHYRAFGEQVTGCIGTHRDISERKRLEERIAEVRESERGRLARDRHDDALQELTHALVQADLAPLHRTGTRPG